MLNQPLTRIGSFYQDLHRRCLADAPPHTELRGEPLLALTTVAVCLSLITVLATPGWYAATWSSVVPREFQELGELAHWSLVTCFFYAIVPWLVLAVQGKSLGDYGVSLHGFVRHAWIYGAMLLIMAPIVWMVSQRAAFLDCYPFHRQLTKTWLDLVVWEALYALQFCALEFFFRGFLLFSLKRYIGVYSIAVMMVPYCMIHFRKPPAEIFASIIAGFALGTVALTTRSIWWGAALHIAVAWSMDALAVWRMAL